MEDHIKENEPGMGETDLQPTKERLTEDRIWTRRFILLVLCNFFMFLTVHATSTALPAYAKEAFGSDDFLIGILTLAVGVSSVASRLFVPAMIRRVSFMPFLAAGLAALLASTLGLYAATTLLWLIALRIFFGLGLGVTSTLIPTAVSHSLSPRRMGEGMGYFGLSFSLASSVGPPFGFYLMDKFGYSGFVTASLASLLLIVPLLVRVGPVRIREHESEGPGKEGGGATGAFDRILIMPTVLMFLYMVPFGGLVTFLAVYGTEIGVERAGLYFFIQALMALVSRPVSGKLFDRFGHAAVIPFGAVLILLAMLVLSYASSPATFLLSAVLFGAGYGTMQPTFQAWMILLVGRESRSTANSMYLISIDLGIALGSLFLGFIAASAGYAGMYRFCAYLMAAFLILYLPIAFSRSYNPAARARLRAESGESDGGKPRKRD